MGDARRHDVLEMPGTAVCTVLCGGETCTDMAEFAQPEVDFLRGFLEFEHGVPRHDTFSRVFRLLGPAQFGSCFWRFMATFAETCQGVVAIDCERIARALNWRAPTRTDD